MVVVGVVVAQRNISAILAVSQVHRFNEYLQKITKARWKRQNRAHNFQGSTPLPPHRRYAGTRAKLRQRCPDDSKTRSDSALRRRLHLNLLWFTLKRQLFASSFPQVFIPARCFSRKNKESAIYLALGLGLGVFHGILSEAAPFPCPVHGLCIQNNSARIRPSVHASVISFFFFSVPLMPLTPPPTHTHQVAMGAARFLNAGLCIAHLGWLWIASYTLMSLNSNQRPILSIFQVLLAMCTGTKSRFLLLHRCTLMTTGFSVHHPLQSSGC